MFDREVRLKKAQSNEQQEQEQEQEEVPQSEQALEGKEPAEPAMSREQAVESILRAPVGAMPHLEQLRMHFGAAVDRVRMHVGPLVKPALAALGAEAVTFGDDVAFASEHPSYELMSHELAHVHQQQAGHKDEATDEAQAEQVEAGDPQAMADMVAKPGGHNVDPALRKKAVTHTSVDEGQLERTADVNGHAQLSAAAIASAIAYNDKKWSGSLRAQILGHLRGGAAAEGDFAENDVQTVARIQSGAGVAEKECDGKIGDTTMAILLHAGLTMTFDEHTHVKPWDVQLLFYPGEFEDIDAWKAEAQKAAEGHEGDPTFNVYRAMEGKCPPGTGRLYVKWKGNLVEKIDCRGGPPITLKDGKHTADPSKAGTYSLGAGAPVRTASWYYSQIGWGAQIRERPDGEIEVLEVDQQAWKTVTGAQSKLADPMQKYDFYEGGTLMKTWHKNDFGERGYRVQGSPGLFIHTTPNDEETVLQGGTPVLEHSHGCLHVNPAERKRLEQEGFLQGGVQLTIKTYDVHLLPEAMRDQMQEGG